MNEKPDTAQVAFRPPLALALAILAALLLDWFLTATFVPFSIRRGWAGGAIVVLALTLAAWAIVTITRAGSNVPTNQPTTVIVDSGPYRFSRNPIYLAMFLLLVGLAIWLDTLWLLATLAVFAWVIRYGVVAREEAYLERKFGEPYRGYCARVRRWL